jgi:integrase
MIRSGKTVVDPTYAVEIPRSQVQSKLAPREALEDEQVRALLATCDTSFDGIRAKAIISLMVYCGLRQIEVFRANVSHFDKKENRMILKVHGKGREQIDDDEFVVIPIHQEERINRWIDLRGRGGTALFTYRGKDHRRLSRDRIYDIVKDRLTEIEVHQGPHSLRHTFVTNAVESGAGGRQVQIAARHRSFDTTARYLHREQRLKFAAEDLVDYGEFGEGEVTPSQVSSE